QTTRVPGDIEYFQEVGILEKIGNGEAYQLELDRSNEGDILFFQKPYGTPLFRGDVLYSPDATYKIDYRSLLKTVKDLFGGSIVIDRRWRLKANLGNDNLYHATSAGNLRSILADGLHPIVSRQSHVTYDANPPTTFLTLDPNHGLGYRGNKNSDGSQAILEMNRTELISAGIELFPTSDFADRLPEDIIRQFRLLEHIIDTGTHQTIPPSLIETVYVESPLEFRLPSGIGHPAIVITDFSRPGHANRAISEHHGGCL
ncbi:MAG: hypothetical protein AABW61_01305, partial [Candidatus Aenigmatarchaeota archaeon]